MLPVRCCLEVILLLHASFLSLNIQCCFLAQVDALYLCVCVWWCWRRWLCYCLLEKPLHVSCCSHNPEIYKLYVCASVYRYNFSLSTFSPIIHSPIRPRTHVQVILILIVFDFITVRNNNNRSTEMLQYNWISTAFVLQLYGSVYPLVEWLDFFRLSNSTAQMNCYWFIAQMKWIPINFWIHSSMGVIFLWHIRFDCAPRTHTHSYNGSMEITFKKNELAQTQQIHGTEWNGCMLL